jgi:hypothetical protein
MSLDKSDKIQIIINSQDLNDFQKIKILKNIIETDLAAVKKDGHNLEYVKKQTPEICLEAVKQDGFTLKYVKDQTSEICLEAVKKHECVHRNVKERQKRMSELMEYQFLKEYLILPKKINRKERLKLCNTFASEGRLDLLKQTYTWWLQLDGNTCAAAARGGHLEVLKWLRSNVVPWSVLTCRLAALGGHLEVLKWARANGCPWNSLVPVDAIIGGQLETLKWLLDDLCPQQDILYNAKKYGTDEIRKWLVEIKYPGSDEYF